MLIAHTKYTRVHSSILTHQHYWCYANVVVDDVAVPQMAGVAMDNDDYAKAATLFEQAMDVNVKCATTYMFRAQVRTTDHTLLYYCTCLCAVLSLQNNSNGAGTAHVAKYTALVCTTRIMLRLQPLPCFCLSIAFLFSRQLRATHLVSLQRLHCSLY
jgi:hypothetical protein